MSFPADYPIPTQKTDGWKADNGEVSCLICDLGNDYHACPKFRRLDPNVLCEGSNHGSWRQASEPAEDSVSLFEAAKALSHGTRVFPHECGNYEHDCPIFQAFKADLMTPKKVYCPFCKLLNDGQCSHFDTSSGYGPAIKICRRCNTFGKHWSNDCPNVARDGPLPPLKYCKICQSREHWSPQCPNA